MNVGAVRLIPSTGGVFEISVAGRSVFSKKATGEFPDPDKVMEALRRVLG